MKTKQAVKVDGVSLGQYTVRREEFKGRATIALHDTAKLLKGDKWSLVVAFGVGKAHAVVTCLSEIRKFVAENAKPSA